MTIEHLTCLTVWSLTPFYNELDVLAIRLAELDDVVDVHVVAEASYTYAGNAKPYVLTDALNARDERLEPYRHKIRVIPVGTADVDYNRPPTQGLFYPSPVQVAGWQRENAQRRALMAAVPDMHPHDIVLLSDVDEIPRSSVVTWYDEIGASYVLRPPLAMHVGALNWRWDRSVPVICRLFRAQALMPAGPDVHDPMLLCNQDTEAMRDLMGTDFASIGDSVDRYGWHLSYMGGVDAMSEKLREAAHPEMATPAVFDRLPDVLEYGDELFGRDRGVHWVPNAPPYLPASAARYDHLTVPNPALLEGRA